MGIRNAPVFPEPNKHDVRKVDMPRIHCKVLTSLSDADQVLVRHDSGDSEGLNSGRAVVETAVDILQNDRVKTSVGPL